MSHPVTAGGGTGRFGFVELVVGAFASLPRLGFVIVRREDTSVRFEKQNVFVNVYHGSSSYQVGLQIGRVQECDTYSLHELLNATAPAEIALARCHTRDPELLGRCLSAIATTIEQHCALLLAGDTTAFARLEAAVEPGRRAATLQAQFGALIDRADKSWESKDLSQALVLYERAALALDEARLRRLKYLRKHQIG